MEEINQKVHLIAEKMSDDIESIQVIAEKNNGSPPERFIQKESKLAVLDSPLGNIPIINLSYVKSKELEKRQLEDSKLKCASLSSGLFQVLGHGIPISLMNKVRNVTRMFFKQSHKEKQNYSLDKKNPDSKEGFKEGYGREAVLSHEQFLDWNDKLHLKLYPEEERNMDLWPKKPESFKETIIEFNEKVVIIVDEILKALARSLGLHEAYFINNGVKGRIPWRFKYYSFCSKPDLVLGMKPHSDGTSITLILQDDRPGDEIEIMSNGVYKSALHKVVTNSEKERISLSIFVRSGIENELGPIDELIEEGKPKLYKNITAKDYRNEVFLNFAQGKRPIGFMRI
ncbi:hypothetical protein ZOSMA_91G00940 [Zostera marina]|uniref:Fe2OG dioxygenase domain-containing protein n=1 Tax=Zostera marina TaxID=29655 RepID=A0A0K9NL73_ZOSMR|nr:hypothetical protein ZOSMA_91G00940 [Zostera marina]